MSKCIHVVNIGNYLPEVWSVTYPRIKRYADRIGADLNLITQRKYPDWNILYEKLQVYRDGAGYDWNLLLDVDILIHTKFPDFTTLCHPYHVGFNDNFHASEFFDTERNIYFKRDGRNVGIATNAVIACRHTHDLFRPLDYTASEAKSFLLHQKSHVDEFAFSENLARFGLRYNGITWEDWQRYYFVHLGTGVSLQATMDQMDSVLNRWRSDGTES
jgi:hypothetical protein